MRCCFFLSGFGSLLVLLSQVASAAEMNPDQLEARLKVLGCGTGPEDAEMALILSKGKALYPQLQGMLVETDNLNVAANILGIFGSATAEKTALVLTVREFLNKNGLPEAQKLEGSGMAVRTIGEIGGSEDALFLVEGLNGQDRWLWRSIFDAVSKSGDSRSKQKIKEWLRSKAGESASPAEIDAAHTAIRVLSKRTN